MRGEQKSMSGEVEICKICTKTVAFSEVSQFFNRFEMTSVDNWL